MVEDESWYDEREFLEWSKIVLEDESEKEGKLSSEADREPVLCECYIERGDWEVQDEGRGRGRDQDQEEDGL